MPKAKMSLAEKRDKREDVVRVLRDLADEVEKDSDEVKYEEVVVVLGSSRMGEGVSRTVSNNLDRKTIMWCCTTAALNVMGRYVNEDD